MLHQVSILLLLLCPFIQQAQSVSTPASRVYYQFEHVRDTLNPRKIYQVVMMLELSDLGTRYRSYLRFKEDSIGKEMTARISGEIRVPRGNSEQIFYAFDSSKRWIVRQGFPDLVAIPDTTLFIPWQLQAQTKVIAGLSCQLATGRYRGRIYDAWFCPDIPVPAGPWKLHGLPGLIVEAADRTGTVRFTFQGMHPIPSVNLNPPANATLQSQQEYDAVIEKLKRDPEGYINNMIQAGRATENNQRARVRISNVDQLKERAKNGINNPLELPH